MKLLIPGPVELDSTVSNAMAKPIMGHRTPIFSEILNECWSILKEIYNTRNDIALITGSGTSAMEAAVASVVKDSDEVVVIEGGKFGERFGEISEAFGAKVNTVPVEWGKSFTKEDVEKVVSDSNAKVITLTHNETSTGVIHNAEIVGKIAREYDMLFIMDAVTSLGGDVVETDKWGVDLCVSGSQKCLAAPPGLGFVAVSNKAYEAMENNQKRKAYYLDLLRYRKALKKETTPYSPSVSLIYGLNTALLRIKDEGINVRIERHRKLARVFREAVKAMNLELFADSSCASNTVTSIKIPEDMNDDDIRGNLLREFEILVAGGQAHVKGKIFRIGHMGNVQFGDIIQVLGAMEIILKRKGHSFKLGEGVKTALEEFL
ncbi:MAG TPA: alanine--glyoxylate aminotransferase family protein [Euryarchaeota archaeon]|nr:alanine--glyoxylate aminotransferase family protein [Euryarchaeota archaeon]